MAWDTPAPPPPPPPSGFPQGLPTEGRRLAIQGRQQEARWIWIGPGTRDPEALWVPLEVLEGQLGVVRRNDSSRSDSSRSGTSLELEWFGQTLLVGPGEQRSLDDEVAVNALPLFRAVGLETTRRGGLLELRMPPSELLQVRSSKSGAWRRVVLDLASPVLVGRSESTWLIELASTQLQREQLQALGLLVSQNDSQLQLKPSLSQGARMFSLGDPSRVVLEFSQAVEEQANASRSIDPRLQRLLGEHISWERLERRGIRLNSVRIDPRSAPVQLRLLTSPSGLEGLNSVQALANTQKALVAVNGGYFNRVKRLPLGALKSDGNWLSSPILNRGVAAWNAGSLPRFGRLSLEESLSGPDGQRFTVVAFNSGYVQRGISRYGPEWGPTYRALSGGESGLVLGRGVVVRRYGGQEMESGVALRRGEILLVGRGGVDLPWAEGTAVKLTSRPSNELGLAPYVIGGGPLLLLNGRIVLNGGAETFSSGFLNQGAPRTVIGSDGKQLWLITLEGLQDSGPSLGETAQLLQELGLRDALNLDGGSSTGLVMGGTMPVKGRGVVGVVHNGLGLVPSAGASQ